MCHPADVRPLHIPHTALIIGAGTNWLILACPASSLWPRSSPNLIWRGLSPCVPSALRGIWGVRPWLPPVGWAHSGKRLYNFPRVRPTGFLDGDTGEHASSFDEPLTGIGNLVFRVLGFGSAGEAGAFLADADSIDATNCQ